MQAPDNGVPSSFNLLISSLKYLEPSPLFSVSLNTCPSVTGLPVSIIKRVIPKNRLRGVAVQITSVPCLSGNSILPIF